MQISSWLNWYKDVKTRYNVFVIFGCVMLVVFVLFAASRLTQPTSQPIPTPKPQIIDVTDDVATITVDGQKVFRLKDGKAEIAYKQIDTYQTVIGNDEGWLRVKVGDTWVELVNEMVIYSSPYTMTITKGKCEWGLKAKGDTGVGVLRNCSVRVRTKEESVPKIQPIEITKVFKVKERLERDTTIVTMREGDYFIYLRPHLSDIDSAYRQNPLVSAYTDLVTNFGAINVAIESVEKGYTNHALVGSQRIQYRVSDISDSSFELEVTTENITSQPQIPIVVAYR